MPHDDSWFDALFRAHLTEVHRYAARRVPPADVDDITAETFATAWRRRADVPDGSELPWLYRTCGFLIANFRRKAVAVPVERSTEPADDIDPEMLVVQDDVVRSALGRLGARDRQILILTAWDGLVGDQLAAFLGISRGGADAALSRARARFEQAWAEAARD